MLSSAASLFLLASASFGGDLNERELKAWKKVQPSIANLIRGGSVCGTAALIDRSGLFLAHRTALSAKTIEGRLSDGSVVQFEWIATDEPTQFVLLRVDQWKGIDSPLEVADSDAGSKSLLALTPSGPVRAERAGDTYGVVNPSRRFMPLSEMRLENNIASLGGALVIDLNGRLAGAINAALELSPAQNIQRARGADSNPPTGVGGGGGGATGGFAAKSTLQFGPGILTTAYSISPKVLRRVVDGFRNSDHIVKHPAIGIFCRDAVPSGALIDSVTTGSTAEKAGLMKNDVITQIGQQAVRNQVDFARIMVDQEVGTTLQFWILRAGLKQLIKVSVGTSASQT